MLGGEIAGRMQQEMQALRAFSAGRSDVVIDCRSLRRIEFVAAGELLNEVVFEAFRTAHRLKPDVHPHPWLLGIAVNLVKRKQVEIAKRERREPLMRDLLPDIEVALSDEELFDQLPVLTAGMLDRVEVKHDIDDLLACVSRSDGDLLRLAFFHDLNREALAKGRIRFDDLHDSGIYSWGYLYELGRRQDELWAAYLKALEEKGLSRDP